MVCISYSFLVWWTASSPPHSLHVSLSIVYQELHRPARSAPTSYFAVMIDFSRRCFVLYPLPVPCTVCTCGWLCGQTLLVSLPWTGCSHGHACGLLRAQNWKLPRTAGSHNGFSPGCLLIYPETVLILSVILDFLYNISTLSWSWPLPLCFFLSCPQFRSVF